MNSTVSCHRLLLVSLCLTLAACGGGGGGSGGGGTTTPAPLDPDAVVDTFAFVSASPYASVLRSCTYAGSDTRACTIGTLPFLGQDFPDPSIDDIMSRVLVSHQWMGTNLRAVLEQLPPDILLMFRSVTAVVIASDIRPAYYTSETGAIYLDADYLWLTPAEEAVVTDEEDFRSGFGDALQFKMPWRYVRNNERLGVNINPDGSRDLDELLPILGFLLYHELAHAMDFMPQSKMAGISDGQTVEQAIVSGPFLSSQWRQGVDPLDPTLIDLAGVSFLGDPATASQRAITPDELVPMFTADGAVQYYAYSTQFEDFATAFETVMMDYHFGYQKDTGITTNTEFSNDGVLSWGVRGRIGEQGTNTRVRAAVQTLYPGDLAAVETFLSTLPAPQEMTPGATWGENLVFGPAPAAVDEGIDKREFDDILNRRPIR